MDKDLPYYGLDDSEQSTENNGIKLSLLPTDYQANYAHESLYRFDALENFIGQKLKHPYDENEHVLSPEEQINLRHFLQKTEDLKAKFIVKVANHYKTASLTPKVVNSPFEQTTKPEKYPSLTIKTNKEHKPAKTSVLALIIMTILICIAAYYFGL